MRGDCLTCSKISTCSTTSVVKALSDFTCVLYEPVLEPVYVARVAMMQQYGEEITVRAMLEGQNPMKEGEE